MAGKFTVSLGKIIDEFHLETIYMPKDPTEILIDENDVTRPGLQLMGFYEYFNPERMQIIGKMEFAYLSTIDEETRTQRLDALDVPPHSGTDYCTGTAVFFGNAGSGEKVRGAAAPQ